MDAGNRTCVLYKGRAHTYDASIQEANAWGSKVCHLQPHSKLQPSLGHMRPCSSTKDSPSQPFRHLPRRSPPTEVILHLQESREFLKLGEFSSSVSAQGHEGDYVILGPGTSYKDHTSTRPSTLGRESETL